MLAVLSVGFMGISAMLLLIIRRLARMEARLVQPSASAVPGPQPTHPVLLPGPSTPPSSDVSDITTATPTEVVWGDPQAPAVTITSYDIAEVGDPVDLPAPTLSKLNNLLTGVPAVLATAGSVGTYVVTFSPQVTQGLASGALELMQATGGGFRASAMSGGRIVENGVLTSGTLAKSAVALAAVWQVAALVTGQKFMADIESRLRDIDSKLSTVLAYMEGDLRATIIAGAGYLRDAHRAIANGDVDDRQAQHLRQRLEALDVALASAHQALLHRIAVNQSHLVESSVAVPLLWGADCQTRSKEIADLSETGGRLISDAINALAVRGMAIQLRAALGDRSTFNDARAAGLVEDARNLRRVRCDHEAATKRHIRKLKGSWWSKSKAKALRADLNAHVGQTHGRLSTALDQAADQSDALQAALSEARRTADVPTRLAVTVDDHGQITAVSKPKPA